MTAHPIPDAALEADIAILGKKGRGKTYTAKGIVERLLDMNRRVVVLDPLSTWWGLKALASGREGYPVVVFGGPHGDVELDEGMGRGLGRFLAREDHSAVIDLGQMRKGEQSRLVADLLDELFSHNRDPLWLVLEEADVFAPQQPREGDSTRVLGEVDRIARRGRAFGFRLISITQRAARLHKDVLTQLSTLVALGVTSPQDRDAVKAWVEGNADRDQARAVMDSMASLGVGEGWVWAPDFDLLERVRFPKIRTLDTSATPKAGEKRVEPKRLAKADLTRIRTALEAECAPAVDPPERGGAGERRAPAAGDIAAAEARGYERGVAEATRMARLAAEDVMRRVRVALGDATPEAVSRQLTPAHRAVGASGTKPARQPPAAGAREGLGAERKCLLTLVQCHPSGLTEAQWATLTGLKRSGGTWSTYKSRLRTAGLVALDGDLWRATPEGLDVYGGVVEPPASITERIAMWRRAVGAAGRLLDILCEAYPAAMTREELALRAGLEPSGGTFSTYLSRLAGNELVVKAGETVRAADALFRRIDEPKG